MIVIGFVISLMLQASVISSVNMRGDEQDTKKGYDSHFIGRSKANIENTRRRPSSAQVPLTPHNEDYVDENYVVREQIAIGAKAINAGFKPNSKKLAPEPYPGCRKIYRSPMGVKLKGLDVTNGLMEVYKCPGYSALVTYTDVAAPIDGAVTVGFPEAETDAVINGGAVSRSFYAVPGKGGRVTDIWIGKRDAMTVSLISNILSLKEMQLRADLMTETLTKSL